MELPSGIVSRLKREGVTANWSTKRKGFTLTLAPEVYLDLSTKLVPTYRSKRFLFWTYKVFSGDRVTTLSEEATRARALSYLRERKRKLKEEGYNVVSLYITQ